MFGFQTPVVVVGGTAVAYLTLFILSLRRRGFKTWLHGLFFLYLAVGIIWALGNIFAFESIRTGGKMSHVVPLYNTNTLIAVGLVILLLKEIPVGTEMIRVILGAILITVGAILVA